MPAAPEATAPAKRKMHATVEPHAERVRHRLLLDDSILSIHGVSPWEQDKLAVAAKRVGRRERAAHADENLRQRHAPDDGARMGAATFSRTEKRLVV